MTIIHILFLLFLTVRVADCELATPKSSLGITLTSTHIESYDNNSIMYPHSNPPYSSRSACRPSTSAIVHPNGTALSTQSSVATRNLNSEIANLTCSTFGINANDVFKSQSNKRLKDSGSTSSHDVVGLKSFACESSVASSPTYDARAVIQWFGSLATSLASSVKRLSVVGSKIKTETRIKQSINTLCEPDQTFIIEMNTTNKVLDPQPISGLALSFHTIMSSTKQLLFNSMT